MKRAAACIVALLAMPAGANVLYKSVDANGTVTFSDVPPPEGSRLLEQRILGAPGYAVEAPAAAPPNGLEEAFQMLDYDAALREANERVDLAERALASARAGHATTTRPGLNPVGGLATPDVERIEFYKKDLRMARLALADLLRSRSLASGRAPR